ncbi:MAG: restriction endonuclease subunit S, partial [Campylobacterota bacterium]|nr:restriction endonuclease subunit S [Campylobacterota bacterium]
QALRFDNFSLVDLLIIPEIEQEEIAEFLDKATAKIDKAIDLQRQQIIKLKEYKTTLIDSVVTGKVRIV